MKFVTQQRTVLFKQITSSDDGLVGLDTNGFLWSWKKYPRGLHHNNGWTKFSGPVEEISIPDSTFAPTFKGDC